MIQSSLYFILFSNHQIFIYSVECENAPAVHSGGAAEKKKPTTAPQGDEGKVSFSFYLSKISRRVFFPSVTLL